MRILILGINYAPEMIGIGPYTTELAEALVRAGHEVRVVSGQPYYPEWRGRPGRHFWTRQRGGRLDVLSVPHFIPRRPTGAMRLLHHFSFALAAFFPMLWMALFWRPDRVVAIAPSLMAAPLALAAARLSGSTAWLHVQDFELEAAEATGLIGHWTVLSRLLRGVEAGILRAFDHASTISPAMLKRLTDKGVAAHRVSEHRNWGETDRIVPEAEPSRYRSLWNIRTKHVALYSGAMGRKHGLDLVLSAARALAHRDDLTFVICGNGPDRAALERAATGLGNIRFHDLQPTQDLGALLNLASIHLLPQIACAQDLVLPSKLPNMLASGRPVVATANSDTALFAEVTGCGIATEPGDGAAFAAAIERLCDDPPLREQLGCAARARAEARWSRQVILAGFVAAIEQAEKSPAVAFAGQRR